MAAQSAFRGVKSNMMAARAAELAGDVISVATLCGMARQSVYNPRPSGFAGGR